MDNFRKTLWTQDIFGKTWMKPINKYLNISTTKAHVKDLISFLDDNDKREWIKWLCDGQTFSFIYNRIKDKNFNSSFNTKKFCQRRNVAIEFTTHVINFKTVAKPDRIFSYNFRLHSVYLINGKKKSVFTLSKRKRGPDEWLVLLPCTNKISHHINPLNLSVGNSIQTWDGYLLDGYGFPSFSIRLKLFIFLVLNHKLIFLSVETFLNVVYRFGIFFFFFFIRKVFWF